MITRFFTALLVMILPLAGFSQNVGIGTASPNQKLDVVGKLKISDDGTTPTPGTLRFNSTDSVLQIFDGLNWRSNSTPWLTTSNRLHYDNGAVLIGRSTTIGAERFGVRYPVGGANYGGMYIETNGNSSSKPFYGYAINNSGKMWHYYDGASSTWRLYNQGERFAVDAAGNVGIGTVSPAYKLHVFQPSSGYFVKFESNNGAPDIAMDFSNGTTESSTVTFQEAGVFRGSMGYNAVSDYLFLYEGGTALVAKDNKVGIGNIAPGNKLDVRDDGIADTTTTVLALIANTSDRPALQFSEWEVGVPNSGMSIEYDGSGTVNKLNFRGTDAVPKVTMANNGYTGIGTTSPNEPLEIAHTGRMFIGDGGGTERTGLLIDANEAGDFVRVVPYDYGEDQNMDLYFPSDVTIGANTGAVGYKLSVDGKVMSEEIKVQLSQNWPDYVFDKNYHLMSLEETAEFVNLNGHLPGVPSASEVVAAGGVELGEMNRVLLEKIEELTLHVIELSRELETLKKIADE